MVIDVFILKMILKYLKIWLSDKIVFISGVPTVSIKGLISMKRELGREKDLQDIELINTYLDKHKIM